MSPLFFDGLYRLLSPGSVTVDTIGTVNIKSDGAQDPVGQVLTSNRVSRGARPNT